MERTGEILWHVGRRVQPNSLRHSENSGAATEREGSVGSPMRVNRHLLTLGRLLAPVQPPGCSPLNRGPGIMEHIMSLWHIIRFTTIRHLWLITIEPIKHPRRDAFDKWIQVGGSKLAVAW